ncbi:MAG: TRAP transporter small permease [Gammaproteobacteria bacterium]|nr:TRAP transporter small permease [Gammaproteobacteria bacterium]
MRLIGILAGYGIFGLSILIVAEILLRKFANFSVQGVDEIGGYVVAITGTFGMALAAYQRAHTRIDVMLVRLPVFVQAILNLVAYVCLATSASFMAYMAWSTLSESLDFGSVSQTPLQIPLWIPQLLWLLGLIVFCLTALVMALRGLLFALRGRSSLVEQLGPESIAEAVRNARQ